ncbi:MAG TPA: hypothetical protein VGB46_06425, partial [Flavisolibacter sp.]
MHIVCRQPGSLLLQDIGIMGNDFHIDKVTECIEEVSTGKTFDTEILPVTREDLKAVVKKNGWNFPWKTYL